MRLHTAKFFTLRTKLLKIKIVWRVVFGWGNIFYLIEWHYFYKGWSGFVVMKDVDRCFNDCAEVVNCDKGGFGCEYFCVVGDDRVSYGVRKDEERVFGVGVRDRLMELVDKGWKPLEGCEFYGYLEKDGEILGPDYNGGFECRG